jgi:putative DNA primase/helicase
VLSDEVRNLAAKHYGHAGPRFVEQLIGALDGGFRLPEALAGIVKRFPAQSDQEHRAARTFALCALAGELAASWGVTPWAADEPTDAALHAFNLWRSQRGTAGRSSEHATILRAVADFIDRHGDARFSSIEGAADTIRDRAGYWKQDGDDRRLFLFTSGGFREATKGYDLARAIRALDEAGAIAARDYGKASKKVRIPEGRPVSLYHIDPEKLGGDE